MDFNQYQKQIKPSKRYPDIDGKGWIYPAMKLQCEAGEAVQIFAKAIRDKGGILDANDKMDILEELGDTLWYISQIATELDIPLEAIAEVNLAKVTGKFKHLKNDGDK